MADYFSADFAQEIDLKVYPPTHWPKIGSVLPTVKYQWPEM
jgi:hypothetical protein